MKYTLHARKCVFREILRSSTPLRSEAENRKLRREYGKISAKVRFAHIFLKLLNVWHEHNSWSSGGIRISQRGGVNPYYLTIFFQKTAWKIKKFWSRGDSCPPPHTSPDPPMRSESLVVAVNKWDCQIKPGRDNNWFHYHSILMSTTFI